MRGALTTSKTTRLLVISPGAGSFTAEAETKLRAAFSDYHIVEFDPKEDLAKVLSSRARIVVAGGDGTVEFIFRRFADTSHAIGIIPLGTFNNLARTLNLPNQVDKAIAVAREGRARAITLGRVNDRIFVEACAIGLFGETLALGDAAKDLAFGGLAEGLAKVIAAKRFDYVLTGDLEGSGSAMSLVFTNTASIGSLLPVSDTTPVHPYLEFSVHAGGTRGDILRRAVASAVLGKHSDQGAGQVFKFTRLAVTTKPRVRVYADNFLVGRTPAAVTADKSALRVILPS